ncbi:hypothetical protein CAC42_4771 [Sphaceloma murrayae]|uniref:Uncharacterized protein n=1 Tax=Sphaceloma murrayae TaxID=2082308 RepID=A0A2K1QNW4_9PEZI|nr:hypothetical protein CAC42_4771 [Sphaceloma murrayae]
MGRVCSIERVSAGMTVTLGADFVKSIEQSLHHWENLWRGNPSAQKTPTRLGDPLMADCLSLLGSSYYHLYLGDELQVLKRLASNADISFLLPDVKQPSLALKAVKYAASSWLVRAKMGIAHLQRTAALEYGGHVLVTAYEGALILSWWLTKRSDPHHHFTLPDEYADDVAALDEIFRDVLAEIEEQGIFDRMNVTPVGTVPLRFYRKLMVPWVWGYSSTIGERLDHFSQRVIELSST